MAYLAPALFLLAAVLAAASAAAHEKATVPTPRAAITGAAITTVAITRADCARLVAHVPAPDVAYRPGVDVYGREVAPADLGGAPRIELPETILIDIEIDLQARFGIPADPTQYDPDAEVGEVAYRDGRFTFNGQPLQDQAQAELAARCQEIDRQ
ncbi:MAG: hypothetical protein IIA68_00175 [Proteobacteria bacterium]|nr:hypothetical protein [Pseudomonadota bacterium]